ncbi:hypothetical protein, partial [endosymbiont of Riftia pachyptila]|uniref:hypothetical protein n=1 Tax=endosymbiont of Riftia pachyptila TaxID=54396 RepID=UPI001F11FF0D
MKESMCKLGIILLLLLLASFAVSSAEPLETILAVSPDKAVENALARGDKSLIKVPSCLKWSLVIWEAHQSTVQNLY